MGVLFRAALLVLVSLCATASAGEKIVVDEKAKRVSLPGVVAKQGTYKVLKGAIEYVLVSKGGKEYETIFTTHCTPNEIHRAMLKIGLKSGEPAKEGAPPKGQPVRILAEYHSGRKKVRRAIDELVLYRKTGRPLQAVPWIFTGSIMGFDPAANKDVLQTFVTRSIIGLHYMDTSPLFQNPRPEARQENIYKVNVKALPEAGTPVLVIFERVMREVAPGTRRVHLFISGRVQGVGFRAFTQREARRLKLTGWVKNLRDGRVEAVIEGPRGKVDALLAKVRRGPRAARVEKLDVRDQPAEGDLKRFEIRY